MKTNIDRNLPNENYEAAISANSPSLSNAYATLADVSIGTPSGNQLISGGAVYSGTGLDFDVSALVYIIAGVQYNSLPTSVTLLVGDPANPRFDAIVVDETETVSVVQGTPAATPITPAIGEDQVLVQYILVGTNATTPNIATEYIYREGSAPDWAPSTNGTNNTANFSSLTPPPYQGTECVLAEIGRYSSTRGIRFSTGTPVSRADYVQLSFWVYLPVNLIAAGKLRGYIFMYSDNLVSTSDYLGYARFENYCDFTLVGQWQLVSIPTGLFAANLATRTTIGFINFTLWPNLSGYAPVEIAFDEIKLSTGYGPSTNVATVDILENDNVVGDTARINFLNGKNTKVGAIDDILNNKIDVSIDSLLEIKEDGVSIEPSVSGINFTGEGSTVTSLGGVNPEVTVDIPGSVFTSTINGANMIEVSHEADFGPGFPGGARILTSNTTYFVRGTVNITGRLIVDSPGISIKGWNRDDDSLNFTGLNTVGDLITVTDESFEISNLKISSTNDTAGTVALRAINYDAAEYNSGRNKVLTLINCQFRNCFDVWYIEGFDLVDIQNTLVWYIEATTIGCQFKNVSKLQLSSCEYVRWFDETNIANSLGIWVPAVYSIGDIVTEGPTFYKALTNNGVQPSTSIGVDWEAASYSTASMIELLDNAGGPGFGAVNINGGIYHPQQTQNGIDISTSSTTGFGTISSNAFVNVGLDTGKVFLPQGLTFLPEYSLPATVTYDVFANQGILNSTSGVVMTVNGNTQTTAISAGTPTIVDLDVFAVPQAYVRFGVNVNTGVSTYLGKKQIYVSIHCSFDYIKQGKNTDDYTFYIAKNGTVLPGSQLVIPDLDDITGVATLVYGTLVELNDEIALYVSSLGGDGMLVSNFTMLIRE
jgi:hypothetical protein